MQSPQQPSLSGIETVLLIGVIVGVLSLSFGGLGSKVATAGGQLAQYCAPSEEDGVAAQRTFC